jgi:hypothetical protein
MTPFKPTADDYIKGVFDMNLQRKIKAYEKAHPEELQAFYDNPLDLRTIPRKDWDRYLWQPLICPPDVRTYLEGTKGKPLTVLESDNITARLETFYGVSQPYYVIINHNEEFDLQVAMLLSSEAKEPFFINPEAKK